MIPEVENIDFLETKPKNYKTYRIDFEKNRLTNEVIVDLACLEQDVRCIIKTARYYYLIYSNSYGTEIFNTIGKTNNELLQFEIESYIKDCLIYDNRILKVYDFVFTELQDNSLLVELKIDSIYNSNFIFTEVISV